MCRITGLVSKSVTEQLLNQMRDTLAHGGPDDAGSYISKEDGVGISQRRLSIIDLTAGGHQPMFFKDYVIVFNGEIYNYQDVRVELKKSGYEFTTGSDTEVVLKAFDKWGYECVHQFRGMFTFAIWNTTTKKLLLCRDRVGVKPMYWYQKNDLFMFASELKAFHQHPAFDKTISEQAVSLFLQTGYIKSPYCIFEFGHKMMPGSFLELDGSGDIKTWKYWDVREKYLEAVPSKKSEKELIDDCESLLKESFQLRMVADVPVGMFLSGGIDSSIVTALLQDQSIRPLNTFTIGFEDPKYNEAQHAKKVANHLGTHHTELYCNEKHFEEIIPLMPEIYDEPFGDPSGIPTFLVSKLAKEHVSVSLSADGGDEIFTGYNRYLYAEQLYNKIGNLPDFSKKILSKFVQSLNIEKTVKISKYIPIPEHYKKNIDTRLSKLVEILDAKSKLDFLHGASIFFSSKELHLIHKGDNNVSTFDKDLILKDGLNYSAYGVVDAESYLEGDIMAKVDRATMRVALEGREPFLDHKIIEFAMSLPDHMKIRNGETKWILRQILYKHVPRELIERPKMGFGVPIDTWLLTILKHDLITMTNDKAFFECFKIDQGKIQVIVNSFLAKKSSSSWFVWFLYCLHQWYKTWYS